MESTPSKNYLNYLATSPLSSPGSPFVESPLSTPNGLIEKFLRDDAADVILCTHTGIKWHRVLADDRHLINVGAIGRPENDGTTNVWYAFLTAAEELGVEFLPIRYEHERLACEMKREGLPCEFIETIRTGWWTTCLEILPAKERARGQL